MVAMNLYDACSESGDRTTVMRKAPEGQDVGRLQAGNSCGDPAALHASATSAVRRRGCCSGLGCRVVGWATCKMLLVDDCSTVGLCFGKNVLIDRSLYPEYRAPQRCGGLMRLIGS